MRMLVLGAGAIGGYFGGRLVEANAAEVAFLVRPGRKAQLDRDGLVIESASAGSFRAPVTTLTAETVTPGWDVVLLTAKAYDLDAAIEAIRPAVDDRTAVLPLLNGLSHIETLKAAFGAPRVLGGLAQIQATLAPDGTVRHLAPLHALQFGELDGSMSARVLALQDAFAKTPVSATASPDIMGAMWAKLVFLGTLAAANVLMRANLGEIAAAPGGAAFIGTLLDRSAAAAAAAGHPPPGKGMEMYRSILLGGGPTTASMLRDLEAGGRIEADHIFGQLLDAVRRAGIDATLHEAAYLHAKAYEARRAAGRLPGA
jgi:2-dehydropantoate 2-reductase